MPVIRIAVQNLSGRRDPKLFQVALMIRIAAQILPGRRRPPAATTDQVATYHNLMQKTMDVKHLPLFITKNASEIIEELLLLRFVQWRGGILAAVRIGVEHAGVITAFYVWNERRCDAFVEGVFPAHWPKPFVTLDVGRPSLHASEPLGAVRYEQLLHKILRSRLDLPWAEKTSVNYLLVYYHRVVVLVIKRWIATEHLVDQNTKSPPVNRRPVTLGLNNFRGQVFRSAT